MVSGTPHCKGAVRQCCPILGVPFYFGMHPLTPNYQILCGSDCFQGVNRIPVRAGPQGSSIFQFHYNYVCVHPLS